MCDDINDRHRAPMQYKKEVVDQKIDRAKRNTLVLLDATSTGENKPFCTINMVVLALEHGMKVGVMQFSICAKVTGEENVQRCFPDAVSFYAMGRGYIGETQNCERNIAAAERSWERARFFERSGHRAGAGRGEGSRSTARYTGGSIAAR